MKLAAARKPNEQPCATDDAVRTRDAFNGNNAFVVAGDEAAHEQLLREFCASDEGELAAFHGKWRGAANGGRVLQDFGNIAYNVACVIILTLRAELAVLKARVQLLDEEHGSPKQGPIAPKLLERRKHAA